MGAVAKADGECYFGNGFGVGDTIMKILCWISSRNDGILHITDSLRQMGHTVYFFPTEAYREICSYPQKKLDKLGFHTGREAYLEK